MPLVHQTLLLDSITAKCDGHGCTAKLQAGWPTASEAARGLRNSHWQLDDDGKVYCPTCIALVVPGK